MAPAITEIAMDEREQITRMYWNLAYDERTFKKLAQEMQKQKILGGEKKARGAVREWEIDFRRVKHQVMGADVGVDLAPRCPLLEKDLLTRYGTLRHVMIVEVDHLITADADEAAALDEDSQLHKCLGSWAAMLLLAYLRLDDRVGVGSGRGPYYTVCGVNDYAGTGLPRIHVIMSLTGNMSRLVPGRKHFDADEVAAQLRSCLWTTHLLSVNAGLIPDPTHERERSKHLSKVAWSRLRPNVALVGIGALAPGHRLCTPNTPDLKSARTELERILTTAARVDKEYGGVSRDYHCVGDICNRLFLIPPPAWVKAESKSLKTELDRLRHAIDRLNNKIYAASTAQLEQIAREGAVIAVAGGRHKKYAIQHVLNHGCIDGNIGRQRPFITHLVTDNRTAQWLCGATGSREDQKREP